MEKAVIPGREDIKTHINLDEALTRKPPFNPEFIAKAFETNGSLVLNITTKEAGSDRGVWTFTNEEEGWIKIHSKNGSQNGNMHVTSTGQIYVANRKSIFQLVELEPDQFQWITLDWVGKGLSNDLAGDDQFLYTFGGGNVINELKVIDIEKKEVHAIDIDPIANKAGRADLRMDADGTLYAKDDRGRFFEIDRDTGAKRLLVDEPVPDSYGFRTGVANLADGPGASTPVRGHTGWQDLTDGLKDITGSDSLKIDGLTVMGGDLYTVVDNPAAVQGAKSAIYRFDGQNWDFVTDYRKGYGIHEIIAGNDNIFYVRGHDKIYEFNIKTGVWLDISANITAGIGLHSRAEYQDGKLFVISTTKGTEIENASNRAISIYDSQTETWSHLFIDHEMDRKPHLEIEVDQEGNIWFKSNYSGIFRADMQKDGTYAAFEKVHDNSGKIYEGGDGEFFLSYEVTPATQIATTFRLDTSSGEEEWKMTNQDVGYGIDGYAIDGTNLTYRTDSRFGESLVGGSKKWNLPNVPRNKSTLDFGGYTADLTVSDDSIVFVRALHDDSNKIFALDALETANTVVPYDADLKVDMARNLVDKAEKEAKASGLEILEDGGIAVATTVDGIGNLTIMTKDGLTTEESFELGAIRDMASDDTGGRLAIASKDGLFIYDHASGKLTQQTDQAIGRVDMDGNGNVAYVVGKSVTVINASGDIQFQRNFGFSYLEDVALDTESGLVYVVGFSNQLLPDGNPVQGPHLRAYDIDTGDLAWSRFEFGGQKKSGNIADARLYNVEIGEDGELYIMGESAGTETIFRYDGTRLEGEEITTKIDHANNLWNTGSAHVAYHARLDKETGDVIDSQMTMSRLRSSGKSNTYKVGDIAADADGRVYIGGENAAFLMNRDAISINGIDVPDHDGSDPSFMALSQDFKTRLSWHSLDQGGAAGHVEQVATRDGKTVLLTEYQGGELFTTVGDANDGGLNVNLTLIQTDEIYQPENLTNTDPGGNDMLRGSGTASMTGGTVVFSDIEYIRGGDNDDQISLGGTVYNGWGDDGNDTVIGDGKNNWIGGGLGVDSLAGGDGFDMYDAARGQQGLVINLAAQTLVDEFGNTEVISGFEGAQGTQFADRLTGSAESNRFDPFGGADTIDGGAGYDWLDYRDSSVSDPIVADFSNGTSLAVGGVAQTISNVESIIFGSADDVITVGQELYGYKGYDGNDTFTVNQAGAYSLSGGDGIDTATLLGARSDYQVITAGASTIAINTASALGVHLRGVDSVTFAASGETLPLSGHPTETTVYGEVTADALSAPESANQYVWAGSGDDTITGSSFADILYGVDDNDSLIGGDGDDELWGGWDNDTLIGGAGNDMLIGDEGDDIANGGTGFDLFFDRAGTNTFDGGLGTDALLWPGTASTAIVQTDGTGMTTVSGSPLEESVSVQLTNVEAIIFSDQIMSLPTSSSSTATAVYRSFNGNLGSHFFAATAVDQLAPPQNFGTEGIGFFVPNDGTAGTTPVYRFENKSTGAYLLTTDEAERAFIEANLSASFESQGIVFNAFSGPVADTLPVVRYRNVNTNGHFLSGDISERTFVDGSLSESYAYEGVAFYAYPGDYLVV